MNTASPIDRGDFHHQRITVSKIAQSFAIVMDAAHGCRSNSNGVDAAVSDAALPKQWQEADVSAAIMATVEIGERRVWNKTEAIGLEELRQILVAFAGEVKWRLLHVFL